MSVSTPLNADQCRRLAARIEDSVEHCIHLPSLRSGQCRAYATTNGPLAAIVEAFYLPGEPMAFGEDADAIWPLLRDLRNWTCVEVRPSVAQSLAQRLEQHLGCAVRRVADVYHVPSGALPEIRHPWVRLLTAADADLYARSAESFGDDPIDAARIAREGIVAAAVVEDRVVASVEGYPATERFVNLTAETLAPYRNRWLATACAACVVGEALKRNLTPVWSASAENAASLHTAATLGFGRVAEMIYLIPDRFTDGGRGE
jgi:hypothetical protein